METNKERVAKMDQERAEKNAAAMSTLLSEIGQNPALDIVVKRSPRRTVRDMQAWQIRAILDLISDYDLGAAPSKTALVAAARRHKRSDLTLRDYENTHALVAALTS